MRPPSSLASVPYTELHDYAESLLIVELYPALQNTRLIQKFKEVVKCWLCEANESQGKMFVFLHLAELTVYICDSFLTYFALMVMVLLGKHLHGLEVICLQDPGGLGQLLPPASRTVALL